MSDKFAELFSTLADKVLSVKAASIGLASYFLYIGKIPPETWQSTILIILGFRTVNEVAGMVKDSKKPVEAKESE